VSPNPLYAAATPLWYPRPWSWLNRNTECLEKSLGVFYEAGKNDEDL